MPPSKASTNANDPLARLSDGQVEVLRLVAENYSSKEIAARLGISPHTVDQRIRAALPVLGVERRSEAARLVMRGNMAQQPSFSPEKSGTYQRLIYQTPYLAGTATLAQKGAATGIQIRHAGRTGEFGTDAALPEQPSSTRTPLFLPIPTRAHPLNRMGAFSRLLWILLIALGASFSVGMFLAGLESLARLVGS